jgi:hypothetical protein
MIPHRAMELAPYLEKSVDVEVVFNLNQKIVYFAETNSL